VQAVEIEKPASCGEELISTHEMSTPMAAPPAGFDNKIAHLIDIDIVNGNKVTSIVVKSDGYHRKSVHKIQTPVLVCHRTAKPDLKNLT
jgi:hypothetical protein